MRDAKATVSWHESATVSAATSRVVEHSGGGSERTFQKGSFISVPKQATFEKKRGGLTFCFQRGGTHPASLGGHADAALSSVQFVETDVLPAFTVHRVNNVGAHARKSEVSRTDK